MGQMKICPRCDAPWDIVWNFRIRNGNGVMPAEPMVRLCTSCGFLWRHDGAWAQRSTSLHEKNARIHDAFLELQHALEGTLGELAMETNVGLIKACSVAHELACVEAQRQEAVAEAALTLLELDCPDDPEQAPDEKADAKTEAGQVSRDKLAQALADDTVLVEALNAALKRIIGAK